MGNEKKEIARLIPPADLGLPAVPTTDVNMIRDALGNAATRGCNVLAPVTQLEWIPPDHQLSIRVCVFPVPETDEKFGNGVWYPTEGGKLGLHRTALDQLAQAAGISIVTSRVECAERFVWLAHVRTRMKTFDGTWQFREASRPTDLRDDAPETLQFKGDKDKLNKARIFGPMSAETKALNRCIRGHLGLKGGYTRAEAARPFVFPALVWTPDRSDPEIRRMLAAQELGIVDQVYGGRKGGGPVLASPDVIVDVSDDDDDEPRARQLTERVDVPAEKPKEKAAVTPTQQTLVPEKQRENPPWEEGTKGGPPECDTCGKPLSDKVAKYSLDNFQAPLCFEHQPKNAGGSK